jgi:predicted phosphodiesterase
MLYPVLGSTLLGQQIKEISPDIHVYGHSHLNRRVLIDGVTYINNALGYPSERKVTAKCLLCIHDDD